MLQNEHAVIVIQNPHLSNVVLHESPEENQKLNSIAEILAPLTTGTPISHDVLTVIPLHREEKSQASSSIKMLAQAITTS